MKTLIGTVAIIPTWTSLMPAFFIILEDGSERGKAEIKDELMRLARLVDKYDSYAKKEDR